MSLGGRLLPPGRDLRPRPLTPLRNPTHNSGVEPYIRHMTFDLTAGLLLTVGVAIAAIPSSAVAQARVRNARATVAAAVRRDTVYTEVEVEQPAEPVAGNKLPDFPAGLQQAGVEGNVVAQFVVRFDGTIDASSIRILSSSHPGFADSVRDALPTLRYQPARLRGRAVSQLVQQPFVFSLNR